MSERTRTYTLHPPSGFLGAPSVGLDSVAPGDIVLCGYFCDNLGGGPAGARFLARQLRYFSEDDVPPEGVRDIGDLNVFPLEPEKHEEAISDQLAMIRKAAAIPVLVGGDASGVEIMARHWSPGLPTPVVRVDGAKNSSLEAAEGPSLIAVDLSSLGCGLGQRGATATPQTLIRSLEVLADGHIGGALYGLAPALDWAGAGETRVAKAVLATLVGSLQGRAQHAAA